MTTAKEAEPPFVGEVDGSAFRVSFARAVPWTRAPSTLILGKIEADSHGSRLDVTVVPRLPLLVFEIVWFGIMACFLFASLAPLKLELVFWTLNIVLVGVGGFSLSFFPEVSEARRLFREALPASQA